MMTENVPKKRLLEDSFDIRPTGMQFCFDRELFLRDEFNVEKFVTRQKKVVSLEVLRDDLMQYFNILKNSLVELINQDYADFVNLSTNLVGLDREIEKIEIPIVKLKTDIELVKGNIELVLTEINQKNEDLKSLNNKREIIHSIESVQRCIHRLEKWLNIEHQEDNDTKSFLNTSSYNKQNNDDTKENGSIYDDTKSKFDVSDFENQFHENIGQKLERVGNEFSKLEYFTRKCIHHPLMEQLKIRICRITSELQSQLENYTIDSWKSSNKKSVQQALRTYLSINKVAVAEQLYRNKFVKPVLIEMMPSSQKLDCTKLFQNLLLTTDRLLSEINSLVTEDSKGYDVSSEFDFFTNSIFPELVLFFSSLSTQFFSSGNPNSFHERYTASMKFLKDLENRCTSLNQLKNLLNSEMYEEFNNKWNISVYFQIRYQEISASIEHEVSSKSLALSDPGSTKFNLRLIQKIHECILRCWSDSVYLEPLRHRFWKLTLQILNFLFGFLNQADLDQYRILENNASNISSPDHEKSVIHLKLLLLTDLYSFIGIDQTISDSDISSSSMHPGFSWLYEECLLPKLDEQIRESGRESIRRVLSDLSKKYSDLINSLIDSVQIYIKEKCTSGFGSSVSDIPRLYRRTNKPMPTAPSYYLNLVFKPILEFVNECKTKATSCPDVQNKVLLFAISSVTLSYQDQIRNLLVSVKKMEASLMNLKRTRGLLDDSQHPANSSSSPAIITDEDKIHRQIWIDVQHYSKKCKDILSDDYSEQLAAILNGIFEILKEFNITGVDKD